MSRHSKGQSTLINIVVLGGVALVGIAAVTTVLPPTLDKMADAQAIDQAKDFMTGLGQDVEAVAEGGQGSQLESSLRFSRGEVIVDADDDQLIYRLETAAEIISPHTSRQLGDLRMSAMAGVSVTTSKHRGQDCWLLQNDHVQACIRSIPRHPLDRIDGNTVGYWRFNDGSGQSANDSGRFDHDATLGNSDGTDTADPSWVGGVEGDALAFTGDDYVSVGDQGMHEGMSRLSLSAWVRFDDTTGDQVIVGKDDSADPDVYRLELSGGTLNAVVDTSGGLATADTGITPSADTWHHVAATYNGSGLTVFVDGQAEATTFTGSGSVETTTADLTVGARGDGDQWFLDGAVDEVRLWNTSLTPAQVDWLAEQRGRPDYIDTNDLVLSYRNRDTDTNLSADFTVRLNTQQKPAFTQNGTGHSVPRLRGDSLGEGAVEAEVDSTYGIDYTVVFRLLSGADFIEIAVPDA